MRLVFLGRPGSGKGTQASKLSAESGVPHLSTGDMLRDAVRLETDLGRRTGPIMVSGALVPDELVVGVIEERLSRDDARRGFILDGFPRTIPQAEALDRILETNGTGLDAVVDVDVPTEEIVVRIAGRRTCPRCGAVFNLVANPPRESGHCDACGTSLVQRPDDAPGATRNRIAVYDEKTAPLFGYYDAKGLLRKIDGQGPIDAIAQRISALLEPIGVRA